jgi:hypothetical protein
LALFELRAHILLLTTMLSSFAAAAQPAGEVRLTLEEWQALQRQIEELERKTPPPWPLAYETRSIDVRFDRGVLRGRSSMRVQVLADEPVMVPVIGAEASLYEVKIDGKKAVAVPIGAHYAVPIGERGFHTIEVGFALGREQARFARAFALSLPVVPISDVEVDLPERDLEITIEGGVIVEQSESRGRTIARGALDGRDRLVVGWRRKVAHTGDRVREMEARALALVALEDEVVRSRTRLEYRLISGETDRVEVQLPAGVEVVSVSGGSILQWYTGNDEGKARLIVLLKHLVSDQIAFVVETQAPLSERTRADLAFVRPHDASLREAVLAVEGRAGFAIEVAQVEGAREVGVREVPAELRDMSDKPLLFAYRAAGNVWPAISLSIARNTEIPLTQAIVDDLQASTVVTEQGVEVTKLRLYVRNNTRQYLGLGLPAGASVTHALIDGVPFQPAMAEDARILVPLRQSERLADGNYRHTVRPGDTLGAIALMYMGRPDQWESILAANPGVQGPQDLAVGMTLAIPNEARGVKFEESSFVVELAYKVKSSPLFAVGSRGLELPAIDLPVMSATWHLYFPGSFEPLSFTSNLSQLTKVRYDPLRRIRWFIERALEVESAWASGGGFDEYENILSSRKQIYKDEQRQQVSEALSAFPLVGERFRFSRVLLGEERAHLTIVYAERSLLPVVQIGAFLLALLLAFRVVRAVRSRGISDALKTEAPWAALAGGVALAMTGYYVLGVHRATLLGIDAGLALAVLPAIFSARARSMVESARELSFESVWRGRTLWKLFAAGLVLTLALTYPLLLSTFVFVALVIAAVKTREVSHA